MKISTMVKYLWGDKNAIIEIASSRAATYVGFCLVLSAAIARNYDQIYFGEKPTWIVTPIFASLFTSFVIFIFVPKERKQYRSFLNIFWMTAPIAWLYAIPIEMLSSSSYTIAVSNIVILGVVSV